MIRSASIWSDELVWRLAAVAIASVGVLMHANVSSAQAASGESFASPEAATRALYQAVRANDPEALTRILGTPKETLLSEDPVADQRERAQFARKYEEMHRLVRLPDGSELLYTGAENWPFPFPLVSQNGAWHFDPQAGVEELVLRRIGEDELAAIAASRNLFMDGQGGAAEAGARINTTGDDQGVAFHGYYIRRVGAAPSTQSGGATANVSPSQSRFAVVAYPLQYRVTGVMTFVVDRDGSVYQSDLGPNTTDVAKKIDGIDSGHAWRSVGGP